MIAIPFGQSLPYFMKNTVTSISLRVLVFSAVIATAAACAAIALLTAHPGNTPIAAPFERIGAALAMPGRRPAPGSASGGLADVSGAARFSLATPALDDVLDAGADHLDRLADATLLAAGRARYAGERLLQSLRQSAAFVRAALDGASQDGDASHQGVMRGGHNASSPPR